MPKDPHVTGGIRHDWKVIKHEYVTNPDMSLRRVAEKYGVSLTTIFKKSKAEGWFAARKKHQEKVVEKAIAKTARKQSNELAKEAEFLGLMKGHMDKMLHDQNQFQRHLVDTKVIDEDGGMVITTEERMYDKFDSRAMKDSMQVLQMMEQMTRSLYNIQKAEAIQRQQIERERLELEKERLELERQRHEMSRPDTSAVIRIEGFEEGWDE